MNIHQMQVSYNAAADRILWHVRTQGGEVFSAWLTRRMLRQFWPPFLNLAGQTTLPRAMPEASVVPEAREMLAHVARERPLPSADFNAPFNPQPTAQPLGTEPLLPVAIDLGPVAGGAGVTLRLRDANKRSLGVQLTPDMTSALLRLVEKALADADWGLNIATGPTQEPAAAPAPPRVLN